MDIGNIFQQWDFTGTVPLPYRVLLMGCIGIFAWGSNIHILSYLRVDVSNLLFSSPPLSGIYTNHPRHTRDRFVNKSSPLSALYRSTYTLGLAFLAMVLINMWMYKWVVAGSVANIQKNASGRPGSTVANTGSTKGGMGLVGNPRAGIAVPILGYMTIVFMIFIPFNVLFKKERYRFLRSVKKALFSGLKSDVSFADVILADILTSFARVFGDLVVVLCLMFLDWDGTRGDACYGSILVPIMTSIPYCIRLRQCISEYMESNYTTDRHLLNALKYATAFPVIIISSMQKTAKAASVKGLEYDGYLSDNSLFRLWLFFVALNSFYSFYWDIYHDWNLIQIQPAGRGAASGLMSPTTPTPMTEISKGANVNSSSSNISINAFQRLRRRFGMRTCLHYENPKFYYMAAILDFLLRTTWMLKLVSNIQIEEYEGGVFTMQCLEVLRRWIWVIFRLESEMVKRVGYNDAMVGGASHSANASGGIAGLDSMSDNKDG
ncbi:protein-ER retention protein [Mortierella polycephala]|uniref:Protein-ER retention protein n=1 Tax=Mortierella polycephala TaxID=41804 RepID=A0A9P6PWY7_9FUNG|nr:protein-ER retention protein [Mortierella polycephala]